MRKFSKLLFLALATYLPTQAALASTGDAYAGRVNHVYDASTIRVAYTGGGHIRVKLAAIDAPYAERAKQALAQQTLGKTVRVEELRWQEGYLVGRVSVDGKGVCATLVEQGLAKVAEEYAHLPRLRELENEARLARRGIWAKEPEASS